MGLKIIHTGDAEATAISITTGAAGSFTAKENGTVTLKGGEEAEVEVNHGEVITVQLVEPDYRGMTEDEIINAKNQPQEDDRGTPANSLSPAQKNGDEPLPEPASTASTANPDETAGTGTAAAGEGAGTGSTSTDPAEDEVYEEGEVYERDGVDYVGAAEVDENEQPTGKIVLKPVEELTAEERQELVDAGKLEA